MSMNPSKKEPSTPATATRRTRSGVSRLDEELAENSAMSRNLLNINRAKKPQTPDEESRIVDVDSDEDE